MVKRISICVVLLGMLGYAVFSFITDGENEARNQEEQQEFGLEVGKVAPDFELQTMKGEFVQLSDYRDEIVMLNFWATWCVPCQREMPDLEKLYQNTDIKILAVNLIETETKYDDILNFAEDNSLTFPILLDNGEQATDLYHILSVPTTYLIDEKGVIQYRAFGQIDYDTMLKEYKKVKGSS
ncbi:TlpA family protein disulfide reductase [Gracilibacillus dipsosauri]|uniref:TlpA family protein disulfide reductase n=1 Tax=Gracilibacillus dipsosauri TaxID=178340 RepID=UPI00240987A4